MKIINNISKMMTDYPTPNNWAGDKTALEDLNNYMKLGHIACPNCGKKNW